MPGDVAAGEVIAFWLRDDVVTATNVNINPALLADSDLALDRLVPVAG